MSQFNSILILILMTMIMSQLCVRNSDILVIHSGDNWLVRQRQSISSTDSSLSNGRATCKYGMSVAYLAVKRAL